MDKHIIYLTEEGTLAIITPVTTDKTIEEIAAQDVPTGYKFKIVTSDDIPTDRTSRDRWTVDEADLTDGVGQ